MRYVISIVITVLMLLLNGNAYGQQREDLLFTESDSLRGSLTPERTWWDVTFYDLHVTIHREDSTINGFNRITYRVIDTDRFNTMQIDLQRPMNVDYIQQSGKQLAYRRDGNAFFVTIPETLEKGSLHTISVFFRGKPRVAVNPPWDGGFIWRRDSLGYPWIATANQGLGASAWWPNKDHLSDEPDSMEISITVPDPLVNVSNGRLTDSLHHDNGMTTWTWHVGNPINNYNVAVNAGNYVHFNDTYPGLKGPLDLDYWVLEQHLEQAKVQFKEVKPMMQCFEYWFGPYPFYKDSFKLVETPHLGMEHQSAVAYGNGYENGYRGTDLSGTGWGLKFDFIIIHESGHEWWGNSITAKDIADMWVHEGFTNYSENLYVECRWGKDAGAEYVIGTRERIQNDRPIIGEYGVNNEGSSDMYYKGGNLLHTIRQIVNSDELWRETLRGLQRTFYHQTVTSEQVEDYIIQKTGKDLDDVFDQYLRHTGIPTFQYYFKNGRVYYRWKADVSDFDMPVRVKLDERNYSFIHPTSGRWKWSDIDLESLEDFEVDKNFYVGTEEVSS